MDGAPDSAPKVQGSIPRWGDLSNAGEALLLRLFNFCLVVGEPCDLLFLLFPLFAVLLLRRPHPGASRALDIHPRSFNVVFFDLFFYFIYFIFFFYFIGAHCGEIGLEMEKQERCDPLVARKNAPSRN